MTERRSNRGPKVFEEVGPQVAEVRALTRRQVRILLAAAVWTLYVWITRLWIMAGQDVSTGFKVVHAILAFVSIGFALAIGKIALGARRAAKARPPAEPGPAGSPSRERQPVG